MPSRAVSYKERNEGLKTPTAEDAGKGRGSDRLSTPGAGLTRRGALPAQRSLAPAGPCEGAGREGAGQQGRSHSFAYYPQTR